jgi:hypothetical protein
MLFALALGGVAVYLVVVGHTQKQVQVGLLVGLWGLLLGAFSLFGARRGDADEGEVQHARGERALVRRSEHEQQLAVMVRREMERVLRDELSQLRSEVSGLRNDLVEKVNGQLRLERIETTRVISSDIEELQHEVRRLAVASRSAQQTISAPGFAPATVVETEVRTSAPLPYILAGSPAPSGPAPYNAGPGSAAIASAAPQPYSGPPPIPPASAAPVNPPPPRAVPQRPAAPAQARPVVPPMRPTAAPLRSVPSQVPPPAPRPAAPPASPRSAVPPPAPAVTSFPPTEHTTSLLPRMQNPPAPQQQPRPVSAQPAALRPAEPSDPLQSLPRLTRFEYDWESPPERPSPAWDVTHVEQSTHMQPTPSPVPESYTGRRRSPGEVAPLPANGTNGHNDTASSNGSNGTVQPSGGRRRRGNGPGDDVLGRLLGR